MKTSLLLTIAASTFIQATPLPSKNAVVSNCPFLLSEGGYEFPHLIVPINKSDIALGHSYFASVSPNNSAMIFNFDIPSSRANQQCSLYFTFPNHNQLSTSDYSWNGKNTSTEGPGTLQLVEYQYGTGATDDTTGNSQPPTGSEPTITIQNVTPGNAYKIWSGSTGQGGLLSWKLSSPDSWLRYFQDWNACAIGLWIVYEEVAPIAGPNCGQCPGRSM